LMERGFAYQAEDKSVYYRLSRFPDYGKLAHLNLDELRPSGRVQSDEYDKEHIGDFALWKAWDENDGDVAWESPWGRGRPGWHIECSAMSTALLGDELDIHCGAVDNIFPHHEAEIAQTEACTGKQFVRFWVHCAHLIVDGQKMAKSLGNFYTLRDLLARGFTGRELRYALLSVNYRLPLNFTFDAVIAARGALDRLDEWSARIQALAGGAPATANFSLPQMTAFDEALDDDLNISGALGQLFELVRITNRQMDEQQLEPGEAAALLVWWQRINSILELERDTDAIPAEISELVSLREQARRDRNWAESDRLRDELHARGWNVKDTKEGSKVVRRSG
jgi:cysteinyl-tRNA synthetase